MASLRDSVKDYQEELRDGIAWVAFWKQGRSWNAELFHLEVDGTLEPFDRSRLEEIKAADPAAVILNGYYCGHLGENMSLDELTAGVRYHYENGRNDLDGFIGAHDDRLPPEVIEEARAAAHAAGLPFSEKPYRDGEDFDPYIFDGSMSIEDYELMHRMIEKERSEQMDEWKTGYSSYDHDRLEAADKMKIERGIYFDTKGADISPLTALPLAELVKLREESAAAEQTVFENLKVQASAWEEQAGKTLLFDKAIEYARIPEVKHTANKWQDEDNDRHTISNRVYKMSYHVYENTRYDRKAEKSIPYSYTLSWNIYTNSPHGYGQAKIAGQDRKVFADRAAMEKYLNGRIKAYEKLFTEISPAIPPEYAEQFRVNGQLLPGYTVEGEEIKQPAADISAAAPRTEPGQETEQFAILIDSRTRFETGEPGGYWLSMPATKEELHKAMRSVGITADNPQDFFIHGYSDREDRHIALPYDMVCAAQVDELNFLAARLETLDASGIAALNAATQRRNGFENIGQLIDFTYNEDFFVHIPEVHTPRELGDYYLNKSGMVQMPAEWKNSIDPIAFGRNVMKGQKGIKILAPSPFKIKKELEKIDPQTGKAFIGKDGKPVTEEKEITIPAFKVVSVFDVSQTEGKEIPDIAVNMLTGDVEHYKDVFAALEKTSPVPVGFEKIEGGAHGYYHLEDKRIALDEGMSELQTLKTLIHEIAHAKLHDIDLNAPLEDLENRPDRRTREVQAESIAYTVCQHYGLDTSDYSFGYVAGWSAGRDLAELKSSLETIRSTAAEIINSIDEHIAELQKEQAQDAPREKAAMQEYIYKIEANPRTTGDNDRFFLQAYLPQENGRAKIGDVLYIGSLAKCRELMGGLNAGELTQGEVKELYAKAQEAEADKDTFSIYQLKQGDETRDFRFEPYDRLQAAGNVVDKTNYELVYSAELTPGTSLEDIYTRFNIDHPKDFKGHSLSVSDVVVLHQNGQDAAHYVDSFGYKEVPEFLQEQTQQPEKINPLKHVEDTIEQNDNNFDGIINNTPTVDELEAKVKAGEQISLVDLAEAIKADKERGKEKPSIRAQLKADKERTGKKKNAKQKSQDLERS